MTDVKKTETFQDAIRRVAVTTPQHLKKWLSATKRDFIILKAPDLIDALPWPDGVDAFMLILEGYRQYRLSLPVDHAPCPRPHTPGKVCAFCRNTGVVVARTKNDVLELDEMKDAVQWLLHQIREKDSDWTPK